MDGFLKRLGSVNVAGSAAVFFSDINLGIEVRVVGCLSSTITELQAITLALKCMLSSCLVVVCLDSQAALDACVSELKVLGGFLVHNIDWAHTVAVWHPDLHMLSESMSKASASLHTYFIKTVYRRLSIVVRKRLYDKYYSGVLCLHCDKIKFSDYVFMCYKEFVFHKAILFEHILCWKSLTGSYFFAPSVIVESLLLCLSDISLYALLCKSFVLVKWFEETVQIFNDHKEATQILVNFVHGLSVLYYSEL
ncbi:hypothetical protein G9A89_014391 [Geosiphon pyriformis]|nr:hypothetical protein G9A89_014391 [Geosiphon pyriformis]